MITLGLAIAFTAPAYSAEKAPTSKAACEKAHMTLGCLSQEVQIKLHFFKNQERRASPRRSRLLAGSLQPSRNLFLKGTRGENND